MDRRKYIGANNKIHTFLSFRMLDKTTIEQWIMPLLDDYELGKTSTTITGNG